MMNFLFAIWFCTFFRVNFPLARGGSPVCCSVDFVDRHCCDIVSACRNTNSGVLFAQACRAKPIRWVVRSLAGVGVGRKGEARSWPYQEMTPPPALPLSRNVALGHDFCFGQSLYVCISPECVWFLFCQTFFGCPLLLFCGLHIIFGHFLFYQIHFDFFVCSFSIFDFIYYRCFDHFGFVGY